MTVTREQRRKWQKNYIRTHLKERSASQKAYRESEYGKRRIKGWRLKRAYNITVEDYDLMMSKQGNRCAVCGGHQSEMERSFDVDHDHETGEIRGLLCNSCNRALGLMGDSVMILENALLYLRKMHK